MTVRISEGRKPFRITFSKAVLALAGIALFISFISLGIWQVQRRAWKLDLIERVNQRAYSQPVEVPAPAQWASVTRDSHEYLSVRAQGQWMPGRSVLTQAVTELGAGFWLLTPLQQADGTQLLVNRGYVPADQRQYFVQQIASAPQLPQPGTIEVVGLLRMTEPGGGFMRDNAPEEDRWHSRDVAAIAQAKGLESAAPFFMDAKPLPGTPADTWPRAGMTVIQFTNTHAVYALTWFGMALMVIGATVLVVRYERRKAQP